MSGSAAYNDLERLTAPAQSSKAAAPDDSDFETEAGCTLYIGTGGDVCVDLYRDAPGTKTVYKNIPDGTSFGRRVRTLYGTADGTTAEDIVMEW